MISVQQCNPPVLSSAPTCAQQCLAPTHLCPAMRSISTAYQCPSLFHISAASVPPI
ncbi:unnamed protein product, partial [Staurois parvus]